ncbi:hypothetical protein U0070_024385 [Myodes glareolus]|uniref:Uncharacterized protein n=1 Tax=Myodes glareolus TaxID=447135 RepID=A0AAW0IL87_MYOGA
MVNPKMFSNIGDNCVSFSPFTKFSRCKHSTEKIWKEDSSLHKIIPRLMCQGSDFTNHNGRSIYGEKLENKNYTMKYCCP